MKTLFAFVISHLNTKPLRELVLVQWHASKYLIDPDKENANLFSLSSEIDFSLTISTSTWPSNQYWVLRFVFLFIYFFLQYFTDMGTLTWKIPIMYYPLIIVRVPMSVIT